MIALRDSIGSDFVEQTESLFSPSGLLAKAKNFEQTYDALNYRDDQFDLSDSSLSLSLGLLAVSALTGKRWLLNLAWLFAAFGVLMGIAGLCGLHIHPGWLTRLLS